MTILYAIQCRFKITEHSDTIEGLAVCSDPDTPVTFIHPDGSPYTGEMVWNYRLAHFNPWAKFEI